jgi:hypothetical protein
MMKERDCYLKSLNNSHTHTHAHTHTHTYTQQIENAVEIMSNNSGVVDPLTSHYNQLRSHIQPLDPQSERFKLLENYVSQGRGCCLLVCCLFACLLVCLLFVVVILHCNIQGTMSRVGTGHSAPMCVTYTPSIVTMKHPLHCHTKPNNKRTTIACCCGTGQDCRTGWGYCPRG